MIPFKRWPAINGNSLERNNFMTSNEVACLRSHRTLLEYAKAEDIEYLLLIEDDVTFVDNFDQKLSDSLRELPDFFTALYLGGNPMKQAIPVGQYIEKPRMMSGGFGILFRNTIFDLLIKEMKSETMLADHYYMKQQTGKVFKTKEDLILHRQGEFSDIQNKIVSY